MRTLLALALVATLTACGGGSTTDTLPDQVCNPDTIDCVFAYGDKFPYAFESTDANWQVFSFDPAPRAGYVMIRGN